MRSQPLSQKIHSPVVTVLFLMLVTLACRFPFIPGGTAVPPDPLPPTRTPTPTPTVEVPPVVVITPDSELRRLSASVFAGLQAPLAELVTDDVLHLESGGQVTTNSSGEAEITIQDCLKLFVFQETTLVRATCRKEDAASGLAVCGTAGMTGVINNCTAQVSIQTPGSSVITTGTQFAVIYLEKDHLSIVQVYEGAVDVSAVIDAASGKKNSPIPLEAGKMWFTTPGEDTPTLGGVAGREPQPMEVWGAVRASLIDAYPQLDAWMDAAQQRMDPDVLSRYRDALVMPSGVLALETAGKYFDDRHVQAALLQGVPWSDLVNQAWGTQVNITPRVQFADRTVENARQETFDTAKAREALKIAQSSYSEPVTVQLVVVSGDEAALQVVESVQKYLLSAGFEVKIIKTSQGGLVELKQGVQFNPGVALIYLHTSGSAFPGGS